MFSRRLNWGGREADVGNDSVVVDLGIVVVVDDGGGGGGHLTEVPRRPSTRFGGLLWTRFPSKRGLAKLKNFISGPRHEKVKQSRPLNLV